MMNKPVYSIDCMRDYAAGDSVAGSCPKARLGVAARACPGAVAAECFCLRAIACKIAALVRGVRLRFLQAGETGNRYRV